MKNTSGMRRPTGSPSDILNNNCHSRPFCNRMMTKIWKQFYKPNFVKVFDNFFFFNTSQESFTFIRRLPPWGKKGKSSSRTPSFFFWSHFRLIGPWWFQIIYQPATGNFIRISPWRTAGCWTAESKHYIAKWMKVVELDESIFNTIWSLLFCNKNPCCAQYVRSWREKIHI